MKTQTQYRAKIQLGDNTWSYYEGPFESEEMALENLRSLQSRESFQAQIVKIETVETLVSSHIIEAYVPTLDEIAQEIIGNSDGSFYMEWGDDIERLSDSDRSKVEDMVWRDIGNCDHCGWHFAVESLENVDGENLCWRCAEDAHNNEDEEDEEDED